MNTAMASPTAPRTLLRNQTERTPERVHAEVGRAALHAGAEPSLSEPGQGWPG